MLFLLRSVCCKILSLSFRAKLPWLVEHPFPFSLGLLFKISSILNDIFISKWKKNARRSSGELKYNCLNWHVRFSFRNLIRAVRTIMVLRPGFSKRALIGSRYQLLTTIVSVNLIRYTAHRYSSSPSPFSCLLILSLLFINNWTNSGCSWWLKVFFIATNDIRMCV